MSEKTKSVPDNDLNKRIEEHLKAIPEIIRKIREDAHVPYERRIVPMR